MKSFQSIKRPLVAALTAALILNPLLILQLHAQDAVNLTFEGLYRDRESRGGLDLQVPLFSGAGSHFFLDVRGSGQEQSQENGSIGLLYRQAWANAILGLHGALDFADSTHSNTFYQGTFGAHLYTNLGDYVWLDLSGNYYLPEDKRYLIDSQESTSTSQSTSVERSGFFQTVSGPFGSNYDIVERVTRGYRETTTTLTETLFQRWERFEAAQEGYDLEAAVVLPKLPFEPRLFGSFDHRENPFGGADAQTFGGGLEIRPLPGIAVRGTAYENAEVFGTDWSVDVSASFKFGGAETGGITRALSPQRTPRAFSDRITDRVRREPIRITESQFIENLKARRYTRDVDTESEVVARTFDVVLFPNVVFVENQLGIDPADQNGKGQSPFSELDPAVEKAAQLAQDSGEKFTVLVAGTGQAYSGVTSADGLGTDIDIVGKSGFLVTGSTGKTFGGGPTPVISNTIDLQNFGNLTASYLDLSGGALDVALRVSNTESLSLFENTVAHGNVGFSVTDVHHFDAHDNLIDGATGVGISVRSISVAGQSHLYNNAIASADTGISIFSEIAGASAEASNNTISAASEVGFSAVTMGDGSTLDLTLNDNLFAQNENGIYLLAMGNNTITGSASRNTFEEAADRAMVLHSFDGGAIGTSFENPFQIIDPIINGNSVTQYGIEAIVGRDLFYSPSEGTMFLEIIGDLTFDDSNNPIIGQSHFHDITEGAVLVTNDSLSEEQSTVTVKNIVVANPQGLLTQQDNIRVENHEGAHLRSFVYDNFFTADANRGVSFLGEADTANQLSVFRNLFDSASYDDVILVENQSASGDLSLYLINDNRITATVEANNAIVARASGYGYFDVLNINRNTIAGDQITSTGIRLTMLDHSSANTIRLRDNAIDGAGFTQNGVEIRLAANVDAGIIELSNTDPLLNGIITGTTINGIEITNEGTVQLVLDDLLVQENQGDGFFLTIKEESSTTITTNLSSGKFNTNSGHGILIRNNSLEDNASLIATFENFEISGNGADGLDLGIAGMDTAVVLNLKFFEAINNASGDAVRIENQGESAIIIADIDNGKLDSNDFAFNLIEGATSSVLVDGTGNTADFNASGVIDITGAVSGNLEVNGGDVIP